jgi:hypothetical protein
MLKARRGTCNRSSGTEQGLLYWKPHSPVEVAANRVSASSALQPGAPLQVVNSVAVSQTTGKVYFTSSTDVPPMYINGLWLPLKSAQLAVMLVRLQLCLTPE